MATYKVLQDIEAEDKLLGPLTLKQFIFAFIDIVLIVIAFRLFLTGWYLAVPLMPFIAILSILAAPLGRDQPTETWLLAKIRFALKPRVRIWDQDGMLDYVTINVPKRAEKHYTDGLSQEQVRSRLNALASTLDSRGWAVKNVTANLYSQPGYGAEDTSSDRLVAASTLPQDVPTIQVAAEDDIMDEKANPLAIQMESMIQAQTNAHRDRIVSKLQEAGANPITRQVQNAADYNFIKDAGREVPAQMVTGTTRTVAPGSQTTADDSLNIAMPSIDEQALLDRAHTKQKSDVDYHSHLKRLKTPEEMARESQERIAREEAKEQKQQIEITAATPIPDRAKVEELANNSDDLKVSTVAELANHKLSDNDEVVISLH